MAWSWLRRRKEIFAIDQYLGLSDIEFAKLLRSALEADIPATLVMILVAYQNLMILVKASEVIAKQRGQTHTIEDDIRQTAKMIEGETDEIASRRLHWFLFAFFLVRLNRLAVSNPELYEVASDIWLILASSGKFLESSLAHNIVWNQDEKVWFAMLRDERDGIEYIIREVMPSSYLSDNRIRALADQNNVMTLYAGGKVW